MSRFKFVARFFALLLLASLTSAPGAMGREFDDAPNDLSIFQSTLAPSLVEISCSGKSELGVILESNHTFKSILGSATYVAPCQAISQRSNNQSSQLTLSDFSNHGHSAAQLIMAGTGISAPFAWLSTKTNLIFPRVAEDRRAPYAGMWVDIAILNKVNQSVSWSESRITNVDNANLSFSIADPGLPVDFDPGFVFNSHGSVIGLIGNQQNGAAGTLNIFGSPGRCGNAGGSTHTGEICVGENGAPLTASDYWSRLPVRPTSAPTLAVVSASPRPNDLFGAKSRKRFGHPGPTTTPQLSIKCKSGKREITVKGVAPVCPVGYSKI